MQEIINKYKWYAVGIISLLIFFSAQNCARKQMDELHGKNIILKEQVKKLQDGTATLEQLRLKQKDSIKVENAKRQKQQKDLEQKAIASAERVKQLEKENGKTKEKIKSLSLVSVAKELNETYGGNNAVATSNSVDVKGSMPYQILETIADANTCNEIVKEKDVQISVKDSLNSSLKEDKNAISISLFSAEKSIKSYQDLNQAQTDLNNSLQKENKKIRLRNTLNKILLPVAVGLGAYGGYKLAK